MVAKSGLPRPHRLYVQQATPVGSDANGFELPYVSGWVHRCDCREQPTGQGRVITVANGESVAYSSIVFVDAGTPAIETGTRIEVREPDDTVILTGEVKRFSRNDYHARIWV